MLLSTSTLRATCLIANDLNAPNGRIRRTIRCVTIPPNSKTTSTTRSSTINSRLMSLIRVRTIMDYYPRTFRAIYRYVNGKLPTAYVSMNNGNCKGRHCNSAYAYRAPIRVSIVYFAIKASRISREGRANGCHGRDGRRRKRNRHREALIKIERITITPVAYQLLSQL